MLIGSVSSSYLTDPCNSNINQPCGNINCTLLASEGNKQNDLQRYQKNENRYFMASYSCNTI